MPAHIKIKCMAGALLYFLLIPLFLLRIFHINLVVGLCIILSLYAIGGVILYIFYPQIDFSKNTILRGPTNKKWILLTFDDGPSEDTPQLLEVLRKHNVKATFFLLGKKILHYPLIAHQIVDDGHEIGNHTYSHEKLHLKSRQFVGEEIIKTQEIIKNELGVTSQFVRAPHGFKNPWLYGILKRQNLKLVSWTKSAFDTNIVEPEIIKHRIVKNIQNGDIILLHDGRGMNNNPGFASMIQALPKIITYLKEMKFEFVTLKDIV